MCLVLDMASHRPTQAVAVAVADVPEALVDDELLLVPEFVDEKTEANILNFLDAQPWDSSIKRRTQHYGHRFSYLSKSVAQDAGSPMPPCILAVIDHICAIRPPIAPWCADITPRDLLQVTINEYQPGVGIASHVDTHSAFSDGILSLSLGAGISFRMQRCVDPDTDGTPADVSIWLPPRSLLAMRGASRYAWRHGISSRKFDRVDSALPQADSDGWVPRSRRVSITIRCVLPGGVCRCAWPRLCDSQGGGPVALPTRISAGGVTASSSSSAAQSHGGKALRPRHLECFNPTPPASLAVAVIAMRLLNALLVRTYHDPDEFWQAGEVAHRLVFGYGHLTWEWIVGLRGYTHVLPFACAFEFLRRTALDSPLVVAQAPRLIQGLIAGGSDLCVWRFAEGHFGRGAGSAALLCSLTSWFVWYCGVRTYSSCMEAACIAGALASLPPPSMVPHDDGERAAARASWPPGLLLSHLCKATALCAVAVAVRPTALLIVAPLGCYATAATVVASRRRAAALLVPLGVGLLILLASLLLDCICYRRWVVVADSFVRFNVLSRGADYYGVHPWHWYLTAALPAALGAHAPLVVRGFLASRGWRRAPAATALAALVALSVSPHKELRFIYPLVHPLLLTYAGAALRSMPGARRRRTLAALTLFNLPIAAYLSLAHQRAPLDAMRALRAEVAQAAETAEAALAAPAHGSAGSARRLPPLALHIDILTRCHQVPGLAQVHSPHARMSILHCPPPGLGGVFSSNGAEDALATRAEYDAQGLPVVASVVGGGGEGEDRTAPTAAYGFDAATAAVAAAASTTLTSCSNECDCFFAAPFASLQARYYPHLGSPHPWWALWRRRRRLRWLRWSRGAARVLLPGIGTALPTRHPFPLPTHVLLFDELMGGEGGKVARAMQRLGYTVIGSYFHEWRPAAAGGGGGAVGGGAPLVRLESRRLLLLRRRAHVGLR